MVLPVLLLASYTEYLESSGRARDGGICPIAFDSYTTYYTTFLVLTNDGNSLHCPVEFLTSTNAIGLPFSI